MRIEHIIRRNNPYRYPSIMEKIKSFDQYAAEVKTKRAADQLLIDNLLMQLVEAKAGTIINNVAAKLDTMQELLKPVIQFYNEPQESMNVDAKKILREIFTTDTSTKQTKKQENEAAVKALMAERAIEMMKKQNKKALKKQSKG